MSIIRNTIKFFVLLANIIVGLGFLFCAYSPAISPVSYPILACAGMVIPVFIILNICFLIFWTFASIKMIAVPIAFFILGWKSLMAYSPINFSSDTSADNTLKIVTYNVMNMSGKSDEGDIPVIEYIKNSKADIVCLQEFPYRNQKIKKQLQKYYPYIRTCNFNSANAVACLSKYPVRFIEEIKLGSAYNGSALFKVKYKNTDIPLIINHLESNKLTAHDKKVYKDLLKSPNENHVKTDGKYLLEKLADAMSIRAVQADKISRYIENEYSPYMIVCGDFNDTPVSYTHRKISEKLTDAYIEAGNGPGITYNRNLLFFRIDHIMVGKGYRVLECKVDTSIDASDHYPLYSILTIR